MLLRRFLPTLVGLTVFVAPTSAQQLTVVHPGQYTQEAIAREPALQRRNVFSDTPGRRSIWRDYSARFFCAHSR